MEQTWFDTPLIVLAGHRRLGMEAEAAFQRVDAVLARISALKGIRLQVRAQFLINYAWEARGNGFANTVAEEGWKKFRERLEEAREAIERSWALKPNDPRTATLMLMVEKGIGGDRDEMEKWFERAMKADGDFKLACVAKLDWLDPKWHGSLKDMLAFGRACRDTGNWRAGITLLLPDAHFRAGQHLSKEERTKYYHSEEVRHDLQTAYDEYLRHYPDYYVDRSRYAALCYTCGLLLESDRQFKLLGNFVVGSPHYPLDWMKQVRAYVASVAEKEKAKK